MEAKRSESFENDVFSISNGSDTWKMLRSRKFPLLYVRPKPTSLSELEFLKSL
jgi:hypothetical protein